MPNRHLPSLVLSLVSTPATLAVGDLFTVTVTVSNQAPDAAQHLRVNLPLPAAVQPLTKASATGWQWTQPTLAGGATTHFTAVGWLTSIPLGQALLLDAQVQADRLPQILQVRGGALVVPATPRNAQRVHTWDSDYLAEPGRAGARLTAR